MQLSFANMNMELNNFKIIKQPHHANEGIVDVDLIKELVDYAHYYRSIFLNNC